MGYETGYLIPLSAFLQGSWPEDLFPLGETPLADVLGRIGIAELVVIPPREATATVVLRGEVAVGVPGIEGLELAIGADLTSGGVFVMDVHVTTGPPISVGATIPIVLRLPRSVVRVAERASSTDPWEIAKTGGVPDRAAMSTTVEIVADTSGEIYFPPAEGGAPTITFTPLSIGGSDERVGAVLDITSAQLVFDDPEGIAADLPEEFRGVFIPTATLYMPPDAAGLPTLEVTKFGIGTGGFFGKFEATYTSPLAVHSLLGMGFKLAEVSIDIEQGAFRSAALSGEIQLPFFDEWLGVSTSFDQSGDFSVSVTAASTEDPTTTTTERPDGLIEFSKEDLFDVTVESIGFEKQGSDWAAILAGSMRPRFLGLDWPEFQLRKLAIHADGRVEIDGGWIDLPESTTLDFFGFKLTLTKVGFGSETEGTTEYSWFGASGELSLVEGVPITGSVEGLKFRWPKGTSGPVEVSMNGVGLELNMPKTLELKGSVAFEKVTTPEGGFTGDRFIGDARLKLPQLRTELGAGVIVSKVTNGEESFTALLVTLDGSFPTGIPLGATGTSLYGIAGLFGLNVGPDRYIGPGEEMSWYDWYKDGPTPNSIQDVEKWRIAPGELAVGAGLGFGTSYDDGTSLNGKVLVAVLVPGPVVVLDGRVDILKPREGGEGSEGGFFLLGVVDGRAGTLSLNVDAKWKVPSVLDVHGGLEAFFNFNDSSDWYLNLGRKDPREKRIGAELLSIFDGSAYLMIDSTGIRFGGDAGWELRKKLGPVALAVVARAGIDAAIMWRPVLLEGDVFILGEASLKIFGIGFGILMELRLGGKTPDPWYFYGFARFKLGMPWPLPDIGVKLELEWGGDQSIAAYTPLLKAGVDGATIAHHKEPGAGWLLSVTESAPTYVPVDGRALLAFTRPLQGVGGGATRLAGQSPELVDGRQLSYLLDNVQLDVKEAGVWTPHRALRPTAPPLPGFPLDRDSLRPDTKAQEPMVELWRTEPYAGLGPSAAETMPAVVPVCSTTPIVEQHHVFWNHLADGTAFPADFLYMDVRFRVPLNVTGTPTVMAGDLSIPTVWVELPAAARNGTLKLSTGSAVVEGYLAGVKVLDTTAGPGVLHLPDVDTLRIEPAAPQNTVAISEISYELVREIEEAEGAGDAGPTDERLGHYGTLFLEPEREYRMTVDTAYSVDGGADVAYSPSTFYFNTLPGPGVSVTATPPDPAQLNALLASPLHRMETYVRYTLPAHGAKMFYPGYDIAVEFDEPYVQGMYLGHPLSIRVRDKDGVIVGETLGSWALLEYWASHMLWSWMATAERDGCGAATGVEPPRTPGLRVLVAGLAPQRLYRVEVIDETDAVLHSFEAATSRFATFAEHVASVELDPPEVGPRAMVRTLPADVATVWSWEGDLMAAQAADVTARADLATAVATGTAVSVLDARHAAEVARAELEEASRKAWEIVAGSALPDRPLPPRLELYRIDLGTTARGALVIDSPEPLEWTDVRVTIGGSDVPVHILRNADHTRTILVPPYPDDGFAPAQEHTLELLHHNEPGLVQRTVNLTAVDDGTTLSWVQ